MDKSGWVPIDVVKSSLGSVKDTAQILRIVASDEKGRFQARISPFDRPVGRWERQLVYICALSLLPLKF
jgi:RNA:NAD 2'-phosphotransferase (TPT1/KptA family)